jgi:glucose/mannose transport system permease protein
MASTDHGVDRGRRDYAKPPIKIFKNLSSKIAAIPMILTALVIFVGCSMWTIVYERLWGARRWLISVENLFIFGACSLVFTLVIGFVLAALLDRKIRFENAFRTIFLYPFALSFVVTGLVWQWILNPEFGIQSIVRNLGWDSFTFDPLYNSEIVIYGILIAGLWQGTGLIMCIMLAGMRGIDEDIWKATKVDGIGTVKTYIVVIIPMMKPVFVTALVLIAAGIVKVYDLVVAQTSGGPGISSEVPAKYVYDTLFGRQNLGQGFAASTMMLVMVVIILIPYVYLQFGGKKNQ